MDTEKRRRFEKALKSKIKIQVGLTIVERNPQKILVRFFGELGGERADYAWRRRNQWANSAQFLGKKYGVDVEIDFSELIDAYSGMLSLAQNALLQLLSKFIASVTVEFNQIGKAIITFNLGDRESSSGERDEIERTARLKVSALFKAGIERVVIIDGGMSEPSAPQILRLLRIHGPCDVDRLRVELEGQGYRVNSLRDIKQKLDGLRKRMLVKYLEENRFALTALALERSPGLAKRNSLDVLRALHFGRAKW